jgi:Fe-S-cluster containining protein
MNAVTDNPCLSCGACCMSYRVSFYWAEAEQRGLPASLTEQVTPFLSCMAGTNAKQPRCGALRQAADGSFACRVYAQRPDPCREVQIGDSKCLQARMRHGLPPLQLIGLPA